MIFTKCSHAIANHISPAAAWVFGVIEYWSTANARKKKKQSLKNGLYCVYLSWTEWRSELPFYKHTTIRDAVRDLKKAGVIAVFKGDSDSGRANYYAVDQQGWLKFQAWSSGYVLSAEAGRALTPVIDQVPDADLDDEEGVVIRHDTKSILSPHDIDPVAKQQDILSPNNRMPHTLDIKNKYKEETKNKVAERVAEAPRAATQISTQKTDGAVVWDAYASAYRQRYGFEPIRNAAINSICKRLHQAVGDEAVVLVQHYVSMNKRYYLEKSHPLSTCLADIQAIKTAYMTGKTMTYQQIKEIEQRQTAKETSDEIQQSNGELAAAWAGIDTKRTIKI